LSWNINVVSLAVILLSVGLTSLVWYKYTLYTGNVDSESWLRQQIQIDTLKACYENDVKPCNLFKNQPR
jgi:hypothetical protein